MSEDGERRRTDLAVERTYLAWWRTGMTGYGEYRRRKGGDASSSLMLVITEAGALLGVALIVLLAIAP